MKKLILAAALLVFAGCAGNLGPYPKPDTVVYTAKAAYETALTGMVAYAKLPRCTAPAAPRLCSSPPILEQMEKARAASRITIDAAESAVRTPGFGQDAIQTAVTAAEAATKALTAITATLPK